MALPSISNLQTPAPAMPDLAQLAGASPGPQAEGGVFQTVFEGAIRQVEDARHQGAEAVGKFLSGEGEELHTTVLATQRAELAFELFLQVRNKKMRHFRLKLLMTYRV